MKPILFSTDMVRAIPDGRKTATRRVVKRSGQTPTSYGREYFNGLRSELNGDKSHLWAGFYKDSDIFFVDGEKHIDAIYFKAPYQPGDILYVPEAWKCRFAMLDNDGLGYEVVFRDGKIVRFRFEEKERAKKWAKYARKNDNHWQSPYFMPREAARIFLRVTNVRVERLQDITDEQAISEGCQGVFAGDGSEIGSGWNVAPTDEFSELWDNTIKKANRALYGWEANPWVWVIEFERISREDARI